MTHAQIVFNLPVINQQVKYNVQIDQLSVTLSALAHPIRRDMLARLAAGDASVTELAEPHDMSLAAISKHLKVLEGAGLISRGKDAQWRPCHLEAGPLSAVLAWVEDYRSFWERNADSLGDYLKTIQTGSTSSKTSTRNLKRKAP
ncbi:ArsR/SmtB family transcription factor [Paraburkholderia sediminicola]|uniref:ArsR/SmtB family transcription factor n=1 Tax=Paraburkholderia sediminicola TaxID=458836 RepID=UPI001FE2883D|nr:metalloregulator ArsR/SmtB family transcription factor [Paraburkholderia sediminicola]